MLRPLCSVCRPTRPLRSADLQVGDAPARRVDGRRLTAVGRAPEDPDSAISGHLMLELEWLLKAESGLQCQTGAAQDEARWSGFRGRLRFDLQRSYDKRASGQFMTSPSNLDTPS
jgi:hypothetical protein